MTASEFLSLPRNLAGVPYAHSGRNNVVNFRGAIQPQVITGAALWLSIQGPNDPGNYYGISYNTAITAGPPNGAAFEWKMACPQSIHTPSNKIGLLVTTIVGPNIGNVEFSVDNVVLGSYDAYAVGYATQSLYWELTAFDCSAPKVRTVKMTHLPKNAASTDSFFAIYTFGFHSTIA